MTLVMLALVGLGFGLAYVNGANDVSKGIATLVGTGITNYRRAILWGTLWTAVGGLCGAVLAKAMVTTFGNGLYTSGTTPTLMAATATLCGAAAWILIATRVGLPVSTTHAIVGSIAGVAATAYGVAGVNWNVLGGKIFVPLLVTPLVSLVVVMAVLRMTRRQGPSVRGAIDCLCAEVRPLVMASAVGNAAVASVMQGSAQLQIVTDEGAACAAERPHALRLTLDHLHWLTSGWASFARGMNDAPKIVALVLVATALQGSAPLVSSPLLFSLITAGMALGSLVAGRHVTQVLAEKVTPMAPHEGFVANLVTAGLVTAGATLGLPMSTTHVSSGGIVGAGASRSSLNRKTLRDIGLAWVVTLPASALLGISAYAALRPFVG